jgi:hypothetical protein
MSFYSADALPRAVTDLEGVLCAGGVMTLFGRGSAARLAIVLGAPPPVIEDPPDVVTEHADGAEGVPVPDVEAVPVAPAEPSHGQRGPGVVPTAVRESRMLDDPASSWDEGVDEIPDDELPVRDEGSEPEASGVEYLDDLQPPAAATDLPDAPAPGVVTPDPVVEWRAHALCCAFRGRGVPADVERLPDGRPVVRSAYRADLVGLAVAWRREDGSPAVPPDLVLDGPRLRLWVLAAGRRRGRAYTLGLDPHAPTTHEPLLTACQRAGLGATLAGDEDEPVVAIVGRRRQRRLAELVGGRPRTLVDGVWPG